MDYPIPIGGKKSGLISRSKSGTASTSTVHPPHSPPQIISAPSRPQSTSARSLCRAPVPSPFLPTFFSRTSMPPLFHRVPVPPLFAFAKHQCPTLLHRVQAPTLKSISAPSPQNTSARLPCTFEEHQCPLSSTEYQCLPLSLRKALVILSPPQGTSAVLSL